MKVYLATDHAGFELKEKVKLFLQNNGYTVEDCGAREFDKNDDYPDFISIAAEAVSKDPENAMGIIFGGSGQGEAMVANKYPNVRCSVFYKPCVPPYAVDFTGKISTDLYEMVKLTRMHNNANMLSLSARFLKTEEAIQAVKVFLDTKFPDDERHVRRIEKIRNLEKNL